LYKEATIELKITKFHFFNRELSAAMANNTIGTDDLESAKPNQPKKFLAKAGDNIVFRSKWAEINGAMGDLGTYIPIILALSLARFLYCDKLSNYYEVFYKTKMMFIFFMFCF
jgi:hypothetical protein